MNANWLTARGNCFIEFRVEDLQRFQIFLKLFDALKVDTQKRSHLEFGIDRENNLTIVQTVPTLSPNENPGPERKTIEDWLAVFDQPDLAYLGLPLHEDGSAQLKKLSNTPPEVRSVQEQNLEHLFSALADISNAAKDGGSPVPLTERMDELAKEIAANPAMSAYQKKINNELDSNPSLRKLREFADIVDSFEEITFELETCQLIAPDLARLEYYSSGFPFGGRDVLDSLLTFFGFGNIAAENC